MTYLNFLGVQIVLGLIGLFGFLVIFRNVINGKGSLRDSEIIHRALVAFGGMLIGVGIGAQIIVPENETERNSWILNNFSESKIFTAGFFLGLTLVIMGLLMIVLSSSYLRSVLWKPLEDVSEYSAEFGTGFLATRLPLLGGRELQLFSQRFNDNAMILANKLSQFEIQLDLLGERVNESVIAGSTLSSETSSLNEYASSYTNLTAEQNNILHIIREQVLEFVDWYSGIQNSLNEQFVDIKAIAELGNLIAVNAAIESSNLDIPNPGFETIANKLHELANSLENRQDSLRLLLRNVTRKYDEFSTDILKHLKSSMKISDDSTKFAAQVEDILYRLKQNEISVMTSSSKLKDVMEKVQENIPRSY